MHFLAKFKLLIHLFLILIIISLGVYTWRIQTDRNALRSKISQLEEAIKNSNDSLLFAEQEKNNLVKALDDAGATNQAFANEIEKITGKVRKLERLTQTDPQLLQKYSKVYFLNENYRPFDLTLIDENYVYDNRQKRQEVLDRVWPFLRDMIDAAAKEDITIKVASSYRSFGTQAQLKSNYRVTYGAGTANQFSADQGYSEHQLGTTVDLTTPQIGGSLAGFEKTKAYEWLTNHAHQYGFILSYPQNNKFYVFEPWHWRFVGLDLAYTLRNEGKFFYDVDQREISQYLINIFNTELSTTTQ